VYSVFGDESSDATKSRVFAVAALFGNDDDWQILKDSWLDRTGGVVFHLIYALRNGPGESGSAVDHLVTPETLG